MRRLSTIAAIALAVPFIAHAQASPYLPVDDIGYTYVDALMSRGLLTTLSAIERPYSVARIRAAIDSAKLKEKGHVIGSYLEALSEAMSRYELRNTSITEEEAAPFRARATFDFYVTGQTSDRRELMLGDWKNTVAPGIGGYFVMGGGPLAVSVRALLDNRLNHDPEFEGRKDRRIAGRTEDGYVSGQWKYGEIALGRVARNWGPIGFSGLQLGNEAYTYDHLYGRIGTDRVHVSALTARLENRVLSPGVESSRYLSTHRLGINRGRFELGLSESFIYTGVGRGLELSLLNPLNVYGLSWRNEKTDGNLSFGSDFAWRTRSFGTFSGQVLLDDVQIDQCDTVCNEPTSYAFTLTAEGLPIKGDQRWFASYTRVSNLAYRTPNVSEGYSIYLAGLGRDYSDYDEVRIGADIALLPRVPLRLYAAHRRQGEGDFRKIYPEKSQYAVTPVFLAGTVWTANRVGVSGAAMVGRDFRIQGDIGLNHNTNRMNVRGYDATELEGRVRATWVPRWRIRFD
ncbi:MAG TPA: hypothetical protein VHM24_12640 [Gemmatimonadaceae bacterium]|nr:hypothetical protein [Gemmatimonadaceae bacterium]